MEIKIQDQTLSVKSNEPSSGDAQHVQQAVELASLKETIKADERFLKEVEEQANAAVESNKESRSESSGEAEGSRDRASLSDESAHYKENGEGLSDLEQMWGEDAADLAWEDIKNWNPSAQKPVAEELSDLSAIYKELLLAILEHTSSGVREDQLSALDKMLSDLLGKLLNVRMGELESLLHNFGSQTSRNALRAALYYNITGNTLSDRELDEIFKDTFKGTETMGEGRGGIRIPVNKSENQGEQGIIYQPAGEGRIKNDPGYSRRMLREAYISVIEGKNRMGAENTKIFGAQVSISPIAEKTIYSPRDLALAERFASYMNHSGNLLGASALSGGSEELYGFLSALMDIKSQTFCAYSGIDKGLASDLREAIDRLIDFSIQEQFQRSTDRNRGYVNRKFSFQPKDAYKIFYYLLNLYYTTRDLQETANKGLRHAYRQFLKKKEGIRSADEFSFFFSKGKKDAIEDWKDGKRYVEHDFKEFLNIFAGQDQSGLPFGALELSPWGMFAEPEISSEREKAPATSFLYIGGAGLLLILLLIFIFF